VKIRRPISKMPTTNATALTMNPNQVARRSGISLNAVIPSMANLSIFEIGYFDSPEKRSARSYSIPV